jgi:hypothetical protein
MPAQVIGDGRKRHARQHRGRAHACIVPLVTYHLETE